jgi:hypothetical protein
LLKRARDARAAGNVGNAKKLYLDAIQVAQESGDTGAKQANILIEMVSISGGTEAVGLVQRALVLDEKGRGPDAAVVARDFSTLALVYQGEQDFADAEK